MYTERFTSVLNLTIGYSIIFGIFLMNPYDAMFDSVPRMYAPMRNLIDSEILWGAVFIGLAGLAILFKAIGRQGWASFTMSATYVFVAALFAQGDINRVGWALFLLVAIFNLIQWRADGWNHNN